MFDEQPDGDPHGECAAEIHRLEGALLWLLWHHQGASSITGLACRRALNIGQFDRLTGTQIEQAKEWDSSETSDGVRVGDGKGHEPAHVDGGKQ
jgi:hypothetical protein